MERIGLETTGPCFSRISKGIPMPVSGVRMSLNMITPSGLKALWKEEEKEGRERGERERRRDGGFAGVVHGGKEEIEGKSLWQDARAVITMQGTVRTEPGTLGEQETARGDAQDACLWATFRHLRTVQPRVSLSRAGTRYS